MTRRWTLFLRTLSAALCIGYLYFGASCASAEDGPYYRALLIACDRFISVPDMTPVGKNNLDMMEAVLAEDSRGFVVSRQYGITFSREALRAAIQATFAGATENDVSLLYISTHGEFNTAYNNPEGRLYLSDGSLEDQVTAQELGAMLDEIEGVKVLLVDACNSGALIGKGVSPKVGSARVTRAFQTDDYKVLTSSGASEPSWYWGAQGFYAVPPGGSYFTTALALGAGYLGTFAADANKDGKITLTEMYNHLLATQAGSTAQMFPQDDSFPLIVYERPMTGRAQRGDITSIVFGNTALNAEKPVAVFAYTATTATRVGYRITFLRDGQWDWRNGVTLLDEGEWDGDVEPTGEISAGRKQIHLDLSEVLPEDWTYAMIHILKPDDPDSGTAPFIYAGRVLSAQIEGDPELSIGAPKTWQRAFRRELEIFIGHALPCSISVTIRDEEGAVVRQLCVSRPTRPQSLTPEGTLLYWNGLDGKGAKVPAGIYRIEATAKIGQETFTAEHLVVIK